MMMLSNLVWKSWYEMCTKRAIMRLITSPLALIFERRLIIETEEVTLIPGRAAPR
jgi:hypothetical protein